MSEVEKKEDGQPSRKKWQELNGTVRRSRLRELGVAEVFFVFTKTREGKKILFKTLSYGEADAFAIENCLKYKTGIQIKKVYAAKKPSKRK